MTELAKSDKLCTLQLFVVIILPTYSTLQPPTLISEKKILLAVNILLCTEKSVSMTNYLFNIMLTGKERFSVQLHIIWNCGTQLKKKTLCKGIVTSPKKREKKIVDISTSLSRGRQRISINVIFSCNFCMSLGKKSQQYISD